MGIPHVLLHVGKSFPHRAAAVEGGTYLPYKHVIVRYRFRFDAPHGVFLESQMLSFKHQGRSRCIIHIYWIQDIGSKIF